MRIIDIIGNAVAGLDTEDPFVFLYGSENSDANVEADQVKDKLVFLQLPPFSLNSPTVGPLTETYRCSLLLMGKSQFGEKAYTHKEVWGQMVDYSKRLFVALKSDSQVQSVVSADNSMQADQFDANFDGVAMVVNITLKDNLTYC